MRRADWMSLFAPRASSNAKVAGMVAYDAHKVAGTLRVPSAEIRQDLSFWAHVAQVGLRHTECAYYFETCHVAGLAHGGRQVSFRFQRPRGLTLLEVLLVLGLLVVVAALAAPTVGLTLDSNRLRSSGDLVRASLAKARLKAMESGRTYTFRYQPGGNGYVIEAWYSADDFLEASTLALGTTAGGMMSGGAAGQTPIQNPMQNAAPTNPETLPESITFAGSEMTTDMRAAMLMQTTAVGQSVDETWSQPMFFYPDGTSSTARLVLLNARQRSITLTLRGLTGVVKVSRPTLVSEIAQ